MTTDLSLYDFHLPTHLIANFPLKERSQSKLLVQQDNDIIHSSFCDLPNFLRAGDLLIMNKTKVWPARITGHKLSGGKFEMLVEIPVTSTKFLGRYKSSSKPKIGVTNQVSIDNKQYDLKFISKRNEWYEMEFDVDWYEILDTHGAVPIPPYLNRAAQAIDIERYQTIFHDQNGFSAAAPTAGLHFDQALMDKVSSLGVQVEFVNLDISSGTFAPIRSNNYLEHKMHSESFTLEQSCIDAIAQTKATGNRVIAVGTTVVRVLQSCLDDMKDLVAQSSTTNIFIYPGYKNFVMDALITNFHLPKSSLMLLVSAFSGTEKIQHIYQQAILHQYRWLSYGDATLIQVKTDG